MKKTKEDRVGGKEVVEDEVKSKKKKKESEGSRWAALLVLLVTVVAGLIFYLTGDVDIEIPKFGLGEWSFTTEYVIE